MGGNSQYSLEMPARGRVFSVVSKNPRSPLHWLAMMKHENTVTTCIYTRLSPQRLSQHLNLSSTEFHWLSESNVDYALSPSLEHIHHSISTRISSDSGIIWLDAVEYLISRQGFEAFLSFTRSLADEISRTDWTLILPYSPLSLEDTQLAHIRREASPIDIGSSPIPEIQSEDIEPSIDIQADEVESSFESTFEEDLESDFEFIPKISGLTMLSTITESALSPAVLARRIEQWKDMGFDVSNLHRAETFDSGERYAIYREIEDLVRRAIECEKRIQMIEVRGHTVEAAKMRFRIMQLTGLDQIESSLNKILLGE